MTDISVTDPVKAMFDPLDEVDRCEFLTACIDLFSVSDIWDCLSPDQQAELAALRSAQQWRGIESAPRDGEPVLLYKPDERMVGPYMLVGYWGEWPGQSDGWIAVDGKPQGYFSQVTQSRQGYPTHWMPLPADPLPATGGDR